ncbi:MAG TPA: hypothetical protein VNN07_02445 [Candidatus Tectomicrobia bacterium]|nr:hypothetical protein [Candidatus Tectomicrobia bacterium]
MDGGTTDGTRRAAPRDTDSARRRKGGPVMIFRLFFEPGTGCASYLFG